MKRGDNVICTHAPELGVGSIEFIDTEEMIIYLGRNEWLTEFVKFASVAFLTHTENVKVSDLVRSDHVMLYDSLRPGDLVVYGKRKHAYGIVLNVFPRPMQKLHVTCNSVEILENCTRKVLLLKHEILSVQRSSNDG